MELTYKSGAPDALWTPALQPVYLFYGEEDGLKREALRLARLVWRDRGSTVRTKQPLPCCA